ncbi:MAG TPA: aminotransferase class V-fold PLP-dependent enzyme [Thermoanaerobaculia bacterium]|nr:aminotransferase class V-fold PLP-dependent enzyme [Thermoanaerobaculia bacterium]
MLECQRSRFRLPDDLHYLNCAYMAPLAREVEAAGIAGMSRRRNPADLDAGFFFDEADRIRELFARLVDCPDPRRIAVLGSVSYGIASVAGNVPLSASQRVVVLGEQFPSNYYAWSRRCAETGASLEVVAAPDVREERGALWNARLLEAIVPGTAVVALGNVHWSDGTLFDLAAVRRRTREVGALLVIDGTQSVGALPLSVRALDPDALICAGYKTLFGPYSLALGYFGDAFRDGTPLEDNWITRRDSRDFAGLVDYREEYREGAIRYDAGEHSSPILLPMMSAALGMVLDWGPERVQEYCGALTAGPLARARELGYWVEDAPRRAAHLFGVRPPAGLPLARLRDELARRRVAISVRGSAIRVAPQVYNDAGDLEALVAALEAAVGVAATAGAS